MQFPSETSPSQWRTFAKRVGALRLALGVIVLILLPMALLRDSSSEGIGVIPSQVLPGVALIVIWVLPFDIIMSRVFLLGTDKPDHARYRSIVWLNVILLVAMLVFWGPFFLSLLI
jgi:hypothetical protein